MKNSLFFAVFVAVMGVGVANAAAPTTQNFPETPTYPVYQSGAQTVSGVTYAAGSLKDSAIKVAVTKYVDEQAATVSSGVSALASSAATDTNSVTTNGTNIANMQSNTIDKPGTNCGSNQKCGYVMVGNTKQWWKIQE